MKTLLFAVPVLAAMMPLTAQTCSTTSGASVPDGSVAATANFAVGDGFITVSLANQLSDPKSAGQLLSGLQFTLASGLSTGTLGSTSANVRRVNRGGSFTDLGPAATGWALDTSNANFLLCALCTDLGALGPKRLLIGDPNSGTGAYSSANASIAGNKPHNPFTAGTAVFLINVPGVLAGDTVTNATFFFGTAGGASGVPGVGVAATASCSTGGLPPPQ
jgi:hypothetical protein